MIFSSTMNYGTHSNNNFINNTQSYDRQASSASVDSWNNFDPDQSMREMLETSIDITSYLEPEELESAFSSLDDHIEDNPEKSTSNPLFIQEQMQVQHALYHEMNDDCRFNPQPYNNQYSPVFAKPQDPIPFAFQVKKEDNDEEEYEKEMSPIPSTSTQRAPLSRNSNKKIEAAKALQNYKPQTKARAYKLKADEEKHDPCYKLKRARNNDAVRKSRTKSKQEQMERDRQFEIIKKENTGYKQLVEKLTNENAHLKTRLSKYETVSK